MFLDESGANTAMTCTHGRAPSGVRVDGPAPHGHWKAITSTAAVRLGVPEAACLAIDGATGLGLLRLRRDCLAPASAPATSW
ncbi:MAG: hypothetical protein U0800_13405 [Isosphaeraceae bacterium]